MLREEKKKKDRFCKVMIAILAFSMMNICFANELGKEMYFNGLDPIDFIYHYSDNKNNLPNDTINYDDIDEYVHFFNPDVLTDWNNWDHNKSSDDVYNDYIDAADNLYDLAGSQDSLVQEGMLYAQSDAMRIQADKNANDSYTNFLEYYLKEKKLVLATKILDLNYQKSIYELIISRASYEEAKRKEKSADTALKYGSGTQIELLTANKAAVDANSSVILAESSQKAYKRNLLINCGKSYDDDIYLSPIDLEEGVDITAFDLNRDYEIALKNSVQYEIYKRKLENARTDEVKKEYEILLNAAPQKIYNDLENKISIVSDMMDTKYNREIAYMLAKYNVEKARNEYSSGNISSKSLKTVEYNFEVAKQNMEIAKYDCKIAIENYRASVEGFGDC